MVRELEQLIWREGKFIDMHNNPVNPKPIGLPVIDTFHQSIDHFDKNIAKHLDRLTSRDNAYSDVNAYSEVIGDTVGYCTKRVIITFYKI